MSNSLQVFQFETSTIRTVEIDGVVWFVAKDIALALGYSNTTDAVRTHCRKAKSLKDIGSAVGAPPEITGDGKSQPLDLQSKMIPESDVYRMTTKFYFLLKFQEHSNLIYYPTNMGYRHYQILLELGVMF